MSAKRPSVTKTSANYNYLTYPKRVFGYRIEKLYYRSLLIIIYAKSVATKMRLAEQLLRSKMGYERPSVTRGNAHPVLGSQVRLKYPKNYPMEKIKYILRNIAISQTQKFPFVDEKLIVIFLFAVNRTYVCNLVKKRE